MGSIYIISCGFGAGIVDFELTLVSVLLMLVQMHL